MIHELLAGVVEERNISLSSASSFPISSSTSSISSPSHSAASSPSSSDHAPQAQQQQQNLRCPRCDSSNTKFCYYNNYNLTQPRHFCKTCRRYWTKGGALRNVPIGGGCRKAKPAAVPTTLHTKSGGGTKAMGRVTGLGAGLDQLHHYGPDPLQWASVPRSSHVLALIRASRMQNHNLNQSLLNSIRIKEEGAMLGGAAVVTAEPNCSINAHSLSLDHHLGQLPIGSCSSSLWRNENQFHHQYQQQQQNNPLLSDVPTSTGIQELYQRLRSPTASNNYSCGSDCLQLAANNVGSANTCSLSATTTTMATTTTASILEQVPFTGADLIGYCNPAISWSTDLSTATNGAFP